ncbi:MAG: glycosyltransferase family 39 protein [Deltaproteobacteria bacterium]|nr:glycosyltransferase family 39 protein [Deltaproteobacteria bacterium]
MAESRAGDPSRPLERTALAVLLCLAAGKLLIHLLTNGNYGYFRDELYYIACSDRLAWGYVDHPPLSIGILAATRALLGNSIFAIRLPVVLTGALCVILTGLLARRLGGGRYAQGLAALAYLTTAISLTMSSFFSMNAFDLLFWLACTHIVVRLVESGNPRWWLLLGVVAGLGLLNKYSVAFGVFGLLVGMALTPSRRLLLSGRLPAGGALAALIFLPHLAWEVANGLPTAEFIRNATAHKIVAMSPAAFFGAQVIENNPFTTPLWLAGLGYLLFAPAMRKFRPLGVMYVVVLVIFLLQRAKPYYLSPAYPALLAGGAVAAEQLGRRWLRVAVVIWLVIGGVIIGAMAIPVLPPATYIRVARALGIAAPQEERSHTAEMPQVLADRFGWENLTATIARVYNALPPEQRAQAAIVTGNYGEAAAVDFFGPRHGLPPALSGHNNYWLWGPRGITGEVVIAVGIPRADLEKYFAAVVQADTIVSPYALPFETNLPVFVCHHLQMPIAAAWPLLKRYM